MNTALQHFNIHLPISSQDAYVNYVNQIPLLSQAEELHLATQLDERSQEILQARW